MERWSSTWSCLPFYDHTGSYSSLYPSFHTHPGLRSSFWDKVILSVISYVHSYLELAILQPKSLEKSQCFLNDTIMVKHNNLQDMGHMGRKAPVHIPLILGTYVRVRAWRPPDPSSCWGWREQVYELWHKTSLLLYISKMKRRYGWSLIGQSMLGPMHCKFTSMGLGAKLASKWGHRLIT